MITKEIYFGTVCLHSRWGHVHSWILLVYIVTMNVFVFRIGLFMLFVVQHSHCLLHYPIHTVSQHLQEAIFKRRRFVLTSWTDITIHHIRRLHHSKQPDCWRLSASCLSYRSFSWPQVLMFVCVCVRYAIRHLNRYIVLIMFPQTVNAIDCFKCVSVNGANPACEDPFHNNFTSDLLESPCLGGRKGRNGLFPATACLKLAGRYGTIIIINYTHHQITGLLLPRPRPFFFIGGSRIFCRA